jgi:glycosyltransferase involved in cell wall biosynthesis
MRISIIIASFQRARLLQWGLYSLARQAMPCQFETIVVNDGVPDGTESVCNSYRDRLKLKYIFSGQRNLSGPNSPAGIF